MLSVQTYYAILLVVCAYAFLAGRSDERIVAGICAIASVTSAVVVAPLGSRYSNVEAGIFLVDVAAFAGFTFVALRTERFWPLWVAGLQLTTIIAHALKSVQLDLMPEAYAAAARFWVYPIFLIIVSGTWRSQRRRSEQRRQAAHA